jgi:hypothetical protein
MSTIIAAAIEQLHGKLVLETPNREPGTAKRPSGVSGKQKAVSGPERIRSALSTLAVSRKRLAVQTVSPQRPFDVSG